MTPRSEISITSSISSGRFTRSSNSSINSTTTITRPAPRPTPITVLRRIFGDDGAIAGRASSRVVTSETLVTVIIFWAATSRKAFAIRLASSGL